LIYKNNLLVDSIVGDYFTDKEEELLHIHTDSAQRKFLILELSNQTLSISEFGSNNIVSFRKQ
jgi:hypothetical protein